MQISPIAKSPSFGHISKTAIDAFRQKTEGFKTEVKENEDGKYLSWSYSTDKKYRNLHAGHLRKLDELSLRAFALQKSMIGASIVPTRQWCEDEKAPYCKNFESSNEGVSVFNTRPSLVRNFEFVDGDPEQNLKILEEAVEYAESLEKDRKLKRFNEQNYNKRFNPYMDITKVPQDRFKTEPEQKLLEQIYHKTTPIEFKYYSTTFN